MLDSGASGAEGPFADVAKLVYAADFAWSARGETHGAEPPKLGERCGLSAHANPEPSPNRGKV